MPLPTHRHRLRKNGFLGTLAILAVCLISGAALTSGSALAEGMMHKGMGHGGNGHGPGMGMGPGAGMGHHHGADGTGHDMVNMPGLRGEDVSEEETREMAEMFRQFPQISREVTNLPNGIRTVTYSEDEELMGIIVSHVVGMINRVEDGRDPGVFIQSPTLDIFFQRRDRLKTEIETTAEGIVVVQTSDDPELVAALHAHAAEVSDMVARGMMAVHERMMRQ